MPGCHQHMPSHQAVSKQKAITPFYVPPSCGGTCRHLPPQALLKLHDDHTPACHHHVAAHAVTAARLQALLKLRDGHIQRCVRMCRRHVMSPAAGLQALLELRDGHAER